MGWEPIHRARPRDTRRLATPPEGLLLASRGARRGPGQVAHYLVIRVGPKLGKAMGFLTSQPVSLFRGTAPDAGKLAVVIDLKGAFVAKQQENGEWCINLGAQESAALVKLPLEALAIDKVEIARPEGGGWRMVFAVRDDMLVRAA